ncbi:MAG TPA: sulfatase [Vicinamibacteria bacterium]|nr:sulfatase [Vicinamibacteria bacterium]
MSARWLTGPTTALPMIALLGLTACGGSPQTAPAATPTATPPPPKPNLVVVVTDDLDFPSAPSLTRLADLVANQGLAFTRAYVPQPLCAPSRASILTGQYAHNHGVTDNTTPQGFPAFRPHEASTLATWLKAAGYRTSLVGKYLNSYAAGAAETYIPPGWDDWYGHLESEQDGRYQDYSVNDNGTVVTYDSRTEDYSVDAETARAVSFIHSSAGRQEPLFLYLAPQSPHVPANYPGRYNDDFRDATCPRVPSFNESNVHDKPSWIRQIAPMTPAQIDGCDALEVRRLRSMEPVEDEIAAVRQALADTGRLDTTYLFFTSDNGLLMGQHRVVGGKANAYEESARVPLAVRGPGVPVGSVGQPVLHIDLAPTLLELAGVPIPDSVDGRSLVPFLRGTAPASWRSDVLIENWDNGFWDALRTPDFAYIHNSTDELELYDMKNDPYQLKNLRAQVDPSVLAGYEQRIKVLLSCHGASCRDD